MERIDTKKLRAKLLDLAVRGKLVPQDPNDEPASVLLERIRAERAELVKQKKAKAPKGGDSLIYRGSDGSHYEKRGKAKPVCIDEAIEFEIPASWAWSRVGSLCFIGTGATPLKSNGAFYKDGTIPWITSGSACKPQIDKPDGYTTELALAETNCTVYPAGSLVIAMYGEGKTRGSVSIMRIAAATNQACAVLVEHSGGCLQDYIRTCYERCYSFLRDKAQGGNQPNLNQGIISDLLIPVPPLAEQERMLKTLDDYLALVEEIERSQSDLDSLYSQLRSKILDLAVRGQLTIQDPNDEPASDLLARIREERKALVTAGKTKPPKGGESVICRASDGGHYEKRGKKEEHIEVPFDLPEGWAWARLLSLFELDPRNEASDDTDASFLPMAAIDADFADRVHPEIRKWKDIKRGFTQFADGDVVFAKISPCFENGKYFIAKNLTSGIGAGTTELYVLRPASELIDRNYVFDFLGSSLFVNGAKETFKGTAGQQRIKKVFIENCLIPIPPLAEQQRIVERVSQTLSFLA